MRTNKQALALIVPFLLCACGDSKTDATPVAESAENAAAVCKPITTADLADPTWKAASATDCPVPMAQKYGETAFGAVNSSIITAALTGPTSKLGTSFQTKLAGASDARKTEFTQHLASFLLQAFGDPNAKYTGPDMKTAHATLDITRAQYDSFVGDVIVPALQTNGVSADDISKCFAPVVTDPAFKATIINCQ